MSESIMFDVNETYELIELIEEIIGLDFEIYDISINNLLFWNFE